MTKLAIGFPNSVSTSPGLITILPFLAQMTTNIEFFQQREDVDGVRFAWNYLPSTKSEAAKLAVPVSCLYTPLRYNEDLPVVAYDPRHCQQCKAVMNPFCQVDPAGFYICPLCNSRNALPPHYQNVQGPVPELTHTTMEYITTRPVKQPPVFLYVVDLCQDDDNLNALKRTLADSLAYLPDNVLVGLITFGQLVQVHDLTASNFKRSYVFRSGKEYTEKEIAQMLQKPLISQPGQPPAQNTLHRLFQPLVQVEEELINIFESLTPDPWPVRHGDRSVRSTGSAINIATAILGQCFAGFGARIFLFVGGLCTSEPGLIVNKELKEPIRSHSDIDKDNAKYYKKAVKFYEGIANRAAKNSHSIDLFGGCLDQVGFLEMKSLPLKTGGVLLLTDAFTTTIFSNSFLSLFNKDGDDEDSHLLMAFNGTLDIKCSRELKIGGVIGHASSLNVKTNVSDVETGMGGSCQYKICSLGPQHTYGIYFDVANTTALNPNHLLYIQFITHYQHSSGTFRMRVTTICNAMTADDNALANYFDQEAATVLMARLTLHKAEQDDGADVLRWIDRTLIKLCQKFTDYRKDDESSFKLHRDFELYPQFIYHLRRSQFLQVFNNSPDETAFYRHVLLTEDTTNSMTMIQPSLLSFDLQSTEPEPVLLDSVSIKEDRILLLDTFFHILIYHGAKVAYWRKHYLDNPDYAYIKDFLQLPKVEAAELLTGRFPLPRFIDTEEGGSQARFLYSKLNPSSTYNSADVTAGAVVLTDDVSLQVFMSHLKKLVVSGSN